jgi:hypothetical protein
MTTGSNISALQPVITLTGTGTTVSPLSGAVTDFSTSMSTPVLYTVTDGINSKTYEVKVNNGPYSGVGDLKLIQFEGMNILNRENKTIQVYTVTGKMLISSLSDINLSEVPNGIYVVKISNEIYKISVIH